ncbi:MAG TPA: IS1634 family transposase [Streptosporangiaceae bacterium]
MGRQATGAVHVVRVRSRHVAKSGEAREYESRLLRRSFRKPDGKVGNETLANLSALPDAALDAVEAVLKGKTLIEAGAAVRIGRSRGHGHVALVHAAAHQLGLPGLLGPACRERDLACALVISRVVAPKTKLATLAWWDDVTLGPDLGISDVPRDQVYAAMDWLLERQDDIEASLARRHLRSGGIAMFDLSSSWVEGTHCELAARGYSRDGKKGREQIEYGLLTDPEGRPVAIRVFPGNTADPTAFTEAVQTVRGKFGLDDLVMVGDRGMITSARIRALEEAGGLSWITCLRGPAIRKLMADDGPLQLSLFDQQDLAEITSPDLPGERLIACRNPLLAAERARKREDLLAATEKLLAEVREQAAAGRISGKDKIGVRAGRVVNKYKVAKHLILDIGEDRLSWSRDQAAIDAEAALDGIYVIRTPLPAATLDAPGTVTAYKNLSRVERDFRSIKADDLDLRPIHHWLGDRVRAHVLICMLAAYITWHLRKTLAPLTYTDEHPPAQASPVLPARRSAHAATKAAAHTSADGQILRSFRSLLDHLASLTRTTITIGDATFDKISDPTPAQRRAFDLIKAPIPLALTTT